MVKMIPIVLLVLFLKEGSAVINTVNESEYLKMPPLFEMDNYGDCMLEQGGTYCVSSFNLYSEGHSNLMHFIREYSADEAKHFNHTRIHRAVCLTSSCKHYLDASNTTMDPEMTLEGCINETIWRKYELQAKLAELHYCKRNEDKVILDTSDYVVATIYILLIMFNAIGSFYDIILCDEDPKKGNQYLLAFSLRRNWAKLIAPGGRGPDLRMERLKLFNGIRAMTMVCIIFSHTALVMSFTYTKNPFYLEKAYDDPLKQLLFNGSLVTHTFFVMSSFLLAYNLQIHAEKQEIKWTKIPMAILLRWVRLTPAYALVIATISTWMRHIGDGPLWQMIVTSEANYCRQYWWANIFYFNNYIYSDDLCFPQGWYLAADTQLFCLGLICLVVIQRPCLRKIALVILFLVSLVITAAHTYFQDLEAVVIQSPESYRSIYVSDDTFNLVYIRGHTNISTYTLGLAGGLLTYHWQKSEKDLTPYKKYRWVFWSLVPMGVSVILSGGFFYIDGFTPSTLIRVAYATLYKPVFQTIMVAFMIGTIFKFETVYRGIVEWRGFAWAGRVSYSAFLLHTMFQRSFVGSLSELLHMTDYYVVMILCASVFLSFLCGAGLWLLVEAPFAALSRALIGNNK
nr:nose resistant to fluoxetine protein 6-like [Vanessa tameamea]